MAELVEEDRYETSQTVVAAFLVYRGLDLVDLMWEHGVCTFFFDQTPALQENLLEFVSGKALVEPQSFNNAFSQVRNRMFKAKEQGR